MGRPGRQPRHGAARPLHGARRAARRGPGADATATSGSSWPTTPPRPSPTAGKTGDSGGDRRPQPLRRRRATVDRSRSAAICPTASRSRGGSASASRRSAPSSVAGGAVDVTLPADVGARARHRHGRPDAAGGADRPPRHRRGRRQLVGRLERRRRRGRLRRLGQPAVGRRLRQGERGAGHAARRSRSPASRTPGRYYVVVRAPRRRRQRERPVERGRTACRTSSIGWANLQWPPTMTHTISAVNRTDNVYGQVWIDGVTSQPGADAGPDRPARASGRTARTPPATRAWTLGRRRASTPTPATTTSSSRRSCPRRPALRLRLSLHHHRRPRLDLRRPRRHRQRLLAGAGRRR